MRRSTYCHGQVAGGGDSTPLVGSILALSARSSRHRAEIPAIDPLWILNQSIHDARRSEIVGRNQKFEYDKTWFEEESRKRKKR